MSRPPAKKASRPVPHLTDKETVSSRELTIASGYPHSESACVRTVYNPAAGGPTEGSGDTGRTTSLLLQAAKLCDSAADGLTRQEVTVFMSYLSHDGESNDWSNPKPFHEARNHVDTSMLCCCLTYS